MAKKKEMYVYNRKGSLWVYGRGMGAVETMTKREMKIARERTKDTFVKTEFYKLVRITGKEATK